MEGLTSISNSFNNVWHATGHMGLQTVSKVTQWKIYDQKTKDTVINESALSFLNF